MLKADKLTNFYLQIIKAGVLLILFLPLFVYEKLLFPFVFPKTIVFRIIIEVLLIFYLALIIVKPEYRIRKSVLLILITAFVGVMIISSLLGVNPYHSFWSSIERSEGIITWLHLMAFFIILIGVFKTKKDWLTVLNAVIIAGWLQAIYALSQFFNFSFALKTTGERIGGSLGNPSFLASYLIFIIFIAAYLLTQYKSKKVKVYYAALILINIFLLWHTQTRGAIVALAIGMLFFVGTKLWQQPKLVAKVSLVIILISIVALGFFIRLNKEAAWIQSSTTLRRLVEISHSEVSSQNRLIVWGVGLRGFLERPLLGWGWENFNVPFNKHFNPAITRDIGSRPWYDRAHNVIVETGVATGIVGLVLYLLIFAWVIKILCQNKKDNKVIPITNLLFITLLLVYLWQNLFVFDTLSSYIMFFLILAFIQSQKTILTKKKKIVTQAAVPLTKGIVVPFVFTIIIVPIVYFFNIRPVLANYHTVKAITTYKNNLTLTQSSFSRAFTYSPADNQELRFILVQHTRDQLSKRGLNKETIPLVHFAIEEMDKSIKASPHQIPNYLILAELYLATTQLDPQHIYLAEEITKKALVRAPQRYQIYTMLGRIKMSQGRFTQGIDYFKQAISLNENFAEAHWNLAIAYILSHQANLAEDELKKTQELGFDVYNTKNVKKLLQAYQDSKNLPAIIKFLETLVKRFPNNQEYQQSLAELQQLYQEVIKEVQKE